MILEISKEDWLCAICLGDSGLEMCSAEYLEFNEIDGKMVVNMSETETHATSAAAAATVASAFAHNNGRSWYDHSTTDYFKSQNSYFPHGAAATAAAAYQYSHHGKFFFYLWSNFFIVIIIVLFFKKTQLFLLSRQNLIHF